MAYKIRKNIDKFFDECYVNVAYFHLPNPQSILVENLNELPLIRVELP